MFEQRIQNFGNAADLGCRAFDPDFVAARNNFAHRKGRGHFFDVVILDTQEVDERYIVKGDYFFNQICVRV